MSRRALGVLVGVLAAGASVVSLAAPSPLSAFVALAAVLLTARLLWPAPEAAPVVLAAPEGVPAGVPYPQITALIDLFGEGILLLDGERTVIAANLAAARLLARPREAMVGVSLIRAARDHEFLEVIREAAGEPREVALGDERVIFATAGRVESGQIRTVLTLQDLTALRRAERARQELVANVSHELRTPIAAALALAETLESGVEDEAQRARFHQQLTWEVEHLARIVDRLLYLSRLESRQEPFRMEDLAVADLLEEARRYVEPLAERASVSLVVQPDGPDGTADASGEARREMASDAGGLRVHADRGRVLEVLANLLDNAVRHSPAGGRVTLSAQRDADLVRLSVSDQGPGILPQERVRVFERFYTGDRARSEDETGTGLGLAIARHIVMRHGGEIWVDDHGPGATLSFTLPPAVTPVASSPVDVT